MTFRVAIFPWGDVIETFLEPLGLDAQGFASEMTGGWLFGYVEALATAAVETVVIAPSARVTTTTTLVHAGTGVPIVLVPGRRVPHRRTDLQAITRWRTEPSAAFTAAIRAERVDAILVQEYEDPRFDLLVRIGRGMGLPVFATFQGGDRTLSRVERVVRARTIAKAHGLIVASRAERARLASSYKVLPPIAPIGNPLRLDTWWGGDRDAMREMLDLPPRARIAISHCRISIWRKGLDVLLAAWAAGRREADDLLVVIGSGEDRDRFRAMVGATGNVRWIDRYTTDRAELRAWLTAADCYVSASRIEGMPVAPLEAMACGLPVVATDAQGVADIVTGGAAPCGLVVAREDATALGLAIDRVLGDPGLRARFAAAARTRVAEAFAIESVGTALSRFLMATGNRTAGSRPHPSSR
ncbi:glycosyltransferase family 4 protein [uncultured Sphingomonas sp.]|uniref:glycosyltransferase family 4 protein n=1 Tax=uncultured Sphingomonas sp. TaxID=158754 RepID=UPI0035CA1519